jgi:Mg-chelatase subunit ChlI
MNTTKILIATDGYLKDQVIVKKLEFNDEDEAFLEEYEDFDEYVKASITNESNSYHQSFCQTLVLTSDQVEILKTQL